MMLKIDIPTNTHNITLVVSVVAEQNRIDVYSVLCWQLSSKLSECLRLIKMHASNMHRMIFASFRKTTSIFCFENYPKKN